MTTSRTPAKAPPKAPKAAPAAPVASPDVGAPSAQTSEQLTDDVSGTYSKKPMDDPQPQAVTRLDHARNLPEVDAGVKSKPAGEEQTAIFSFKGEDRRTMNVVLVDGVLHQQQVAS